MNTDNLKNRIRFALERGDKVRCKNDTSLSYPILTDGQELAILHEFDREYYWLTDDQIVHFNTFRYNGLQWKDYKASIEEDKFKKGFSVLVGKEETLISAFMDKLKELGRSIPPDTGWWYGSVWIGLSSTGQLISNYEWTVKPLDLGVDNPQAIYEFDDKAWIEHAKKLIGPNKEPEKWVPKEGEKYYMPQPSREEMYVTTWNDNPRSLHECRIDRGIVYQTKEEAIARAKEMLEGGER